MKICTVLVILTYVLATEFVEAASKKQRHHIKHKKSNNNGKSTASFQQDPVHAQRNQRNPKMNYYNTHSWPATNGFYRPASITPLFLRSPSSTMLYPTHWGSSIYNTPSFMTSNMLRRSDDFSSNTPSSMALSSPQSPLMSIGHSQTPTIIDMSAFAGSGLLDNPFTSSNQNMWSMEDVSLHTPKPKFNWYSSFNFNDDGPFGNLFNQFG